MLLKGDNDMKDHSKHKKCIIIFVVISIVILISALVLFFASHSTYIKYNDWWIVGNSVENVRERYGEFDLGKYNENGGTFGYFAYEDDGRHNLLDPSYLDMYYYIKYNSDGIVENVYMASQPGG